MIIMARLRKIIIYSIFTIIFTVIVILFFYSYFKTDNFIEVFFNTQFPKVGVENPYHEFLQNYILTLIIYILVALVAIWIWRIIIRALKSRVSSTIFNTLKVLGDIIIIPFVVIAYLNRFSAFQGTLLGIAAIVGTAIGFASTTTLGNLLAGLYLILSRPFLIDDYIIIPNMDTEGVVAEMGINYTKIDQPDGNTAILPNRGLLDRWIFNTRITKKSDTPETKSYQFKIKKKEEFYYSYPLKWTVSSDETHESCVKTIENTSEYFSEKLVESVTWFIVKRDKLHRTYQMNLSVLNSRDLIDLTGLFMNKLEENYDLFRREFNRNQT